MWLCIIAKFGDIALKRPNDTRAHDRWRWRLILLFALRVSKRRRKRLSEHDCNAVHKQQ